ncbi:MAG: hypothetical protein ACC661_12595, partial [Verrucomicrobiales bacterium]
MKQLEKGVKARLIFVCVGFSSVLSLLSGRLVYLQVVEHEKYAEAAAAHYSYREELPASRGSILDRNGDLLARNQTVYSLVVDCLHLRDLGIASGGVAKKEGMKVRQVKQAFDREEIVDRYLTHISGNLAELLRVAPGELRQSLEGKEKGEIVLTRDVEEDLAQQFRDVMHENRIGGIYLRRGERRYYPSPLSLTHVVGYVSEEDKENERGRMVRELVGREGVEKVFDEVLTGEPGYRFIERDSRKREIHAFRGDEKLPVPGHTVRLTIDMSLQVKLEGILDEAWEKFHPEKISSVWIDPRTGDVLAMASRPHFDLATRRGTRR